MSRWKKPCLIVFAAIGILLAILSYQMRNIESYPKSAGEANAMISFSSALAMYRLNSGELPSAADGLSALGITNGLAHPICIYRNGTSGPGIIHHPSASRESWNKSPTITYQTI